MGTQPIPSRVLMSQAEKKYIILVTTKRWKASTATEEKLPPMQSCLISPQQKLDAKKGTSKKRKQEEDSEDKGRRKKSRGKGKNEKPGWFKIHQFQENAWNQKLEQHWLTLLLRRDRWLVRRCLSQASSEEASIKFQSQMQEKSTTANAKKVILKEAISDDYLLGRYISDWKGRIPSTLLNIMSIHSAKI